MDGDLRKLLRKNLPQVHWVSVESGFTDLGIPDMNGCYEGREFWVECKLARGNVVRIRPGQVAWMSRRVRCGGRVLVAVRRGEQLLLYSGEDAAALKEHGMTKVEPLAQWDGGPARWDWEGILSVVSGRQA